MKDMFGNEVTVEEARALLKKGPKRKPTQPNGYAAPPGTGSAQDGERFWFLAGTGHWRADHVG